MAGSRNLQLLNEVGHEPVRAGFATEPEMTLSFDVNLRSLGLELWDVLVSDPVGAHLVIRGREEGDGHSLDLGDVNKGHMLLAIKPVGRKLLEAISESVHDPVLLGFDRLALLSRILRIVVAENAWEVSADRLQIGVPGGSIDRVNSHRLELHNGLIGKALGEVGHMGHKARGQLNHFVNVLGVEAGLEVRQSVMHLDRTLRVTYVEDLFDAGCLLDGRDVGCIIVETHLGPGPVPVLGVRS